MMLRSHIAAAWQDAYVQASAGRLQLLWLNLPWVHHSLQLHGHFTSGTVRKPLGLRSSCRLLL